MESQRISVVIPLYNKVRHIKRALDSVLAQTYQDFEIIVVNDGSTDGSERLVEKYSDLRIRLINQQNSGVSIARNRGIQEAKADLIALLDADDEWMPDHLHELSILYNKFPECGAFATNLQRVGLNGILSEPIYKNNISQELKHIVLKNFFDLPDVLSCSSTLITKKVFSEIGYFPENIYTRQDHLVWIKIGLKYPIAFSTYIGAKYHLEADNRTNTRVKGTPEHIVFSSDLILGVLDDALSKDSSSNPNISRASVIRYRKKIFFWKASS